MSHAIRSALVVMIAVESGVIAQVPDSGRKEQVIFDGQVQVGPTQRYALSFTTTANLRNGRFAGMVQATGGLGNDIRVVVMNGGAVAFDSGRRRSIVLSVDCSEPGQYTLIFDNGFSLFGKTVGGKLALVHSGIDTEKAAEQREHIEAWSEQTSRIFQNLFETLRADEQSLGTHQLGAQPTFSIANDHTINAWADWSRNLIQINRGLFDLADRTPANADDIVAAVLAHELSHIFYRHWSRAHTDGGPQALLDEVVGSTGLDRVQEKEADILGFRVACQAGYDPRGMFLVFRAFVETDPTASSFMKNHPAAIERLRYLQVEAQHCESSRQ